MPLPAIAAGALITGTAGLLGGAAGNASTARQNRLNREFARETYERQRADALADRAFENEYNSPAAQMARLKGAGLNPNLVYGNGATTQGVSTNSSNTPSYRGEAADWNNTASMVGQAVSGYHQWTQMQAEQDRIKALTKVADQDVLLRAQQIVNLAAQTSRTGVQTEQDKLNLETAKHLQSTTLEAARLQVQKLGAEIDQTKANTQYTLNQDERAALMNAQSLQKGAQEILHLRLQQAKTKEETNQIRYQIENLKKDGILRQLDINLKEKGIQPSDPAYMRIVSQIFSSNNIASQAKDILEKIMGKKTTINPRFRF